MYLQLSIPHCTVHKTPIPQSSTLCLNLIIPNITPGGLFSGSRGGVLYMEEVFHFKSWFLNALGLIHSGVYYQNFTVHQFSVSISIQLTCVNPLSQVWWYMYFSTAYLSGQGEGCCNPPTPLHQSTFSMAKCFQFSY